MDGALLVWRGGGGRLCVAPKGSQSEEGTTNRASVAQRVFGPLVLALGGSQRTGYLVVRGSFTFFPALGGKGGGKSHENDFGAQR